MSMENEKKHDWGMFFIGLVLIICAFVMLAWPGMTLITIAIMAGFMLLFAGGVDISSFCAAKGTEGRGWIALNAALDIILGAMFLIHPVVAASVLPWFAGGFVIAYGIVAAVSAFGLRKVGSSWWLMLINGVLSVIIGVLFIIDPVNFAIFLAVFFMWRGVLMCYYGIVSPRSFMG